MNNGHLAAAARKAWALLLVVPLSGCVIELGADGEAAQALEEASEGERHRSMHRRIARLTSDVDIEQEPTAVIADLESVIREAAPCADVETVEATLRVDFGQLSERCAIDDHVYAGTITMRVVARDEGSAIHQELELFGDDEFMLEGAVDIVRIDGGRYIESALEMSRGTKTRRLTASRHELDVLNEDGTLYGVRVDGNAILEGTRGTRTRLLDGLITREGDVVPEAGTTTTTGKRNRSRTIRFERKDEDTIFIFLADGRRSLTAEIPSEGGVAEIVDEDGRQDGCRDGRRHRR